MLIGFLFILLITFTLGISLVDGLILHQFWILFIFSLIPQDIFSLLAATVAALSFFISISDIAIIGRLCACVFSPGVLLFVVPDSLLTGFFAALISVFDS